MIRFVNYWGFLVIMGFSVTLGAKLTQNKASDAQVVKEADWQRAIHIAETIGSGEEGAAAMVITNSRVLIDSPTIDRIVKGGPDMIPALILVMKSPDVSFDTFTRCYSACDQIISKERPGVQVLWTGGCKTKELPNKVMRIIPNDQAIHNELKFRQNVVKDIEEKYRDIVKDKEKNK